MEWVCEHCGSLVHGIRIKARFLPSDQIYKAVIHTHNESVTIQEILDSCKSQLDRYTLDKRYEVVRAPGGKPKKASLKTKVYYDQQVNFFVTQVLGTWDARMSPVILKLTCARNAKD